MVRSPVHRQQPRSPRAGRPQRRSSPAFSRAPHRRSSASPNRRRPISRAGVNPSDDPRHRPSPQNHNNNGNSNSRHRTGGASGSQPQLSEVNRMPVASMRMRMDDYAPPKPRRNDQGSAIPPLMEQVVVRARREATTRTKDTFWTKKLLDAEDQYSKRGDRWAHSGFKELYRDELGYAEPDPLPPAAGDGGEHKQRDGRDGPPPRDPRGEPRDPRDPRRSSPNRPRDPRAKPRDPRQSPERPRDPRNGAGRPHDPRSRQHEGNTGGERTEVTPRKKNGSLPRGRSPSKKSPSRAHNQHRQRRRRSYSGSYSSGSSSSSTGSYSRSRSYYSRSTYSRSSSGSSSYTSSSSSRSRSHSRRRSYAKRRRSHSKSRSGSSSPSPPRNTQVKALPGAAKKVGGRLAAPVIAKEGVKQQTAMQETTKKVVTKTVSNVVTTKTKMVSNTSHVAQTNVKQSHKMKSKLKIKEDDSEKRKKAHARLPHPDVNSAGNNPVPTNSYYPNDEVNDTTVAARANSDAVQSRNIGTLPSPPNLSQPPSLPVHHHHHHHPPTNHEPYSIKSSNNKKPVLQASHSRPPAEYPPPKTATPNMNNIVALPSPRSQNDESESSSTSDEEELPRKMTLSERFGKLAQLSSQRQEYDGVRMKIVREGGQDKKVYLEAGLGSRSPSPLHPGHERWLAEHQAEYADYQRRYGDIRSWDPHRDLPRDLPPNWEEVGVRYRYYKQSGYFGDRHISLEDYLKWEEWWYQYRDWLKKYGGAAEGAMVMARHIKDGDAGVWGEAAAYDRGRVAARWPDAREGGDRKRRRY